MIDCGFQSNVRGRWCNAAQIFCFCLFKPFDLSCHSCWRSPNKGWSCCWAKAGQVGFVLVCSASLGQGGQVHAGYVASPAVQLFWGWWTCPCQRASQYLNVETAAQKRLNLVLSSVHSETHCHDEDLSTRIGDAGEENLKISFCCLFHFKLNVFSCLSFNRQVLAASPRAPPLQSVHSSPLSDRLAELRSRVHRSVLRSLSPPKQMHQS